MSQLIGYISVLFTGTLIANTSLMQEKSAITIYYTILLLDLEGVIGDLKYSTAHLHKYMMLVLLCDEFQNM